MRSAALSADAAPAAAARLADHERLVTEAVGNAIEFWGFKHNHGRVWALLYLRGEGLSASAIEHTLKLSKGAVSMITRELERWEVLRRVRPAGREPWRFVAETDLLAMVRKVLRKRESGIAATVERDLERALSQARRTGGDPAAIDRVARLHQLAALAQAALSSFLGTARLDLGPAAAVLGRVRRAEGRARGR